MISLSFALTLFAGAQDTSFIVTGRVMDSLSNEPLQETTISVVPVSDSLIRWYTLSSASGQFIIKVPRTGEYFLTVTFQNKDLVIKKFTLLNGQHVVDVGLMKVVPIFKLLKEVVITDQSPISNKGDTLVYKTHAFKTRADASVEELLKKLPGVQVDRSGNVKTHGEQVQKVYVDGKEFFGSDPKMATRNLTADMIEQVHVFDDASEQSKFNGIDDGSRTKAINLKLKKDRRSGTFGNVYSGYGTNKRHYGGLTAHYFKGPRQFSIIGGASNITPAIAASSGQMSNTANNNIITPVPGSGLNRSSTIGVNYHDFIGEGLDINASYLLLNDNNTNEKLTYRETFLNSSTLMTNRNSDHLNQNNSHRLNMKVTYSIDSFNVIVFTPVLSIQNLYSTTEDHYNNFVEASGIKFKSAENETTSSTEGDPIHLVSNLVWRKKFLSPGRTFTAGLTNSYNHTNMGMYSHINSTIYNGQDSTIQTFNKNYLIRNINNANNYSISFSYTEPVGKRTIAEINYSFTNNNKEANRQSFNYNPMSKAYDLHDDSLTNNYEQANRWNRLGVNFKGISKKLNYQLGIAFQQMLFTGNDLSKNKTISQRFANLIPAASLNYRFTSGSLQLQYRGRSNQPDIRQLQDVTDVTSYPYIQKGNPALKQEFVHTATLGFNTFNKSNYRSLFVFITYNNIRNKIARSLLQESFEQVTIPVNLNGVYSFSGTLGMGIPIRGWEGASLNASTQFDLFRNVNMVNSIKNFTNDISITQDLMLNFNSGAKVDFGLAVNISYNSLKHSIQEKQNTSYFQHTFSLNSTYGISKGFTISTTADYYIYTGQVNGLFKNYLMWNASISKTIFKNNKGLIRLSINDILDNNVNITRNKDENYIEDIQAITLRRFAMLTFLYKLNKTVK